MQNIFIDILPPWVETGLQPAFYDLESGTVLQQTARMYAKVRELTEAFNTFTENVTNEVNDFEDRVNATVEEYIEKFTELHDYVHDYFDNLDVQKEINNKLDAMAKDGTLEQLIANVIDADAINAFEKPQELYLAGFFDKDSQPDSYLYSSSNGKSFKRIGNKPWNTVRDADIIFYNNKFYALTTETNEDLSIADLYVSEDLENWRRKSLYIDFEQPETYRNYPCEWFIDDNGDVYISGAYQVGTMVDSVNGRTYKDFRLYIAKILDMDFDNFTIDEPTKLTSIAYNLIDPCIIKKDDVYYMFAKKEANDGTFDSGTIQTFTSTNMRCWTRISDTISTLDGFLYEAPSVIKIGDTYYMYVDNYGGDNGSFMQYITSPDLTTWSSPSPLQAEGYPVRHGSVRLISGIGQKIVNSLETSSNSDYLNDKREVMVLPHLGTNTNNKYFEIADFIFQSNYTSFRVKFNIKDIENDLYDSDIELNIYRGNGTDTVKFTEYYTNYYAYYKLKLVKISNSTYRLYYNCGNTVACHPAITIEEEIGYKVGITFNNQPKAIDSIEAGDEFTPNVVPRHISTSDGFRIENINLGSGETSITASFGRTNNYPSFSCILYGRFNAILFQAQINSSTGNLTQYRGLDLTTQGKTYTLTADDDNHTITIGGLNDSTEYTLLINDITYGDITFSK